MPDKGLKMFFLNVIVFTEWHLLFLLVPSIVYIHHTCDQKMVGHLAEQWYLEILNKMKLLSYIMLQTYLFLGMHCYLNITYIY